MEYKNQTESQMAKQKCFALGSSKQPFNLKKLFLWSFDIFYLTHFCKTFQMNLNWLVVGGRDGYPKLLKHSLQSSANNNKKNNQTDCPEKKRVT
jgi:hypothetical protein